jgi:hypothetical protein
MLRSTPTDGSNLRMNVLKRICACPKKPLGLVVSMGSGS